MIENFQCPVCGRTFHTAMFAALHRESFHQPPPSPEVQQFERAVRDAWNAGIDRLQGDAPPQRRTGQGERG